MRVFKMRFITAPPGAPHVYCRLFEAPAANQTFRACGKLIVAKGSLEDLKQAMSGVTFVEDATNED